jgi:4-amino-4-deoxy-L-arabinose transferase-like glycosyltransferase
MTAPLSFDDMPLHLANLDRLTRLRELGPAAREDPFFRERPEALRLVNATRWPPGVYQLASPLVQCLGLLSVWPVQLTNLLFYGLLLVGLAGLGWSLAGPRVGLWAALLAALCPPLVGATWYLSLDFPLAAMVTVGLMLLVRSRGFSRRLLALDFGLWSALAMHVKFSYPIYLLIPSLVAAVQGLRRASTRRRALLGLGLAGAAAGLLFALLLEVPLDRLLEELRYHAAAPLEDEALPALRFVPWTADWALALLQFAAAAFPWPLLLLAAPGLVLLHLGGGRGAARLRGRWLLLAFLWGSYLLLTLLTSKLERYSLPVYPVLCLLTAWGVVRLVPARWQTATLSAVAAAYLVLLALMQHYPAPWSLGHDRVAARALFYDLRQPLAAELSGLRQRTFHPRCSLGALGAAMARLAGRDGSRRPLGIAYPGTPKDELVPEVKLTYDNLLPLAGHFISGRLLVASPGMEGPQPPTVLTVLPASPRALPRSIGPRRLQASERVELSCEGFSRRLRVGLYR